MIVKHEHLQQNLHCKLQWQNWMSSREACIVENWMSSREARIVEASSQEFPFLCNSKVYITFSITKAVVRVGRATFPADTKDNFPNRHKRKCQRWNTTEGAHRFDFELTVLFRRWDNLYDQDDCSMLKM